MKTIKCSQVGGGDCTFEVTAATPEEAKQQMSEHAKTAHADMVASSTPESMKEWDETFMKVWEEAPENAPDETMGASEGASESAPEESSEETPEN